MKTLMKNSIAVLGCLVLTSAFAERTPTRSSPTELASGGINRDSAGRMPRTFDGLAATQAESVVVRFTNLDIEKSAGAAVLYSRLQSAAKAVCPEYHSRDLSRLHFGRACYNTAVAQAVARIDHQSLTALHMSRVPLFASHGAAGGGCSCLHASLCVHGSSCLARSGCRRINRSAGSLRRTAWGT